MRNKSDLFVDQIKGNIDVLVISEEKLDQSLTFGQFTITDFFSPFRRDLDQSDGCLMVFLREDIPTKLLPFEHEPIEGTVKDLNFLKKKWLLF